MAFPAEEVAGIAINQLKAGDVKVDADRKSEAKHYATVAAQELEDEYGFDPATEKLVRAKQAVIQFVKTSLQGGDGSTDPRFQALATKWIRSVYQTKNETEVENNEDEYETRRVNLYRTLDD